MAIELLTMLFTESEGSVPGCCKELVALKYAANAYPAMWGRFALMRARFVGQLEGDLLIKRLMRCLYLWLSSGGGFLG
eukprot:3475672-Amphidinium_carterae.1